MATLVDDSGTTRFEGTVDGSDLPAVAGESAANVGDVAGVVYQSPAIFVIGGVDKDTPLTGNGVVLTDAYAQWNGNGDGVFWTGTGTDGEQSLRVKTGGGTKNGTLQDKDGNMTVPGAITAVTPQGKYAGANVTIADGAGAPLPFALSAGDALLSLTNPLAPTFVVAGTYAITLILKASGPSGPGGNSAATFNIGGVLAGRAVSAFDVVGMIPVTIKAAAAASLVVTVNNNAGDTLPRDYQVESAVIVKLA